MCIKRYFFIDFVSWKIFLDFYFKKVGGKFLFYCNFNYNKLLIIFLEFYKECIVVWIFLNEDNFFLFFEIVN